MRPSRRTAWKRGGKADSILPPLFVVGTGLPYFWVGMMLIILFAEINPWFPVALGIDPGVTTGFNGVFIGNALRHAIRKCLRSSRPSIVSAQTRLLSKR